MHRSRKDLPEHIADAIRQAWPDDIVDMPIDAYDSPFWNKCSKLRARLSGIPGSTVLYEREPGGGPQWNEGSDPEEDSPDRHEDPRSYYLFFVCSLDERFEFETDTLEPDEDDIEQRFQGKGRIGWAVGISLVAPVAAVMLDQLEVFESGSRSEPDVEPHIFNLNGEKVDLEKHYQEMVDDEGLAVLRKLRSEIVRVLKSFEIIVIPEEDLDKPVAWLRAGEEVFLGETINVRQAFFFSGP